MHQITSCIQPFHKRLQRPILRSQGIMGAYVLHCIPSTEQQRVHKAGKTIKAQNQCTGNSGYCLLGQYQLGIDKIKGTIILQGLDNGNTFHKSTFSKLIAVCIVKIKLGVNFYFLLKQKPSF